MKAPPLHPAVEFAWAIGSAEACRAGADVIEPAHLLLGVLKVAEETFPDTLSDTGPGEGSEEVRLQGAAARELLTLSAAVLTRARRALRGYLREGKNAGPIRQLHRSPRTRGLMEEAAVRAVAEGAPEVGLCHLLVVLLEDLPEPAKPFLGSQARTPQGGQRPSQGGGVATASSATRDAIDALGRDLTALAREGRLPPVVGRKAEMTMLARHMHRTSKRNAILVGDAGVGKTAVVEGLAQRIATGDVPELLASLRIVQVNVGDLMSGTRYRGDLEERIQALLKAAYGDPTLILFLDEIHLVADTGSGGSAMDIANLLKPALARDDFRCIGATTTEEFERYIKPDVAFTRRFQIVRVAEPSAAEAIEVCRAWAKRIEELQRVAFGADAVEAAVHLSVEHIRSRALPDKAIDLLENAAAFVRVASLSSGRGRQPNKDIPTISESDIVSVLEEQYGVSVRRSSVLDPSRVHDMLSEHLVGQAEAIASIADVAVGLSARPRGDNRPLGVLLFAGPTGVGKTLTAEWLAKLLFPDDPGALGRFNMSELKERHELSRLTGAPPGFLGHENQGSLFRFVSGHPTGVVLLDEMEKAHPEIQDYFLQIFDKGETTDSRGTKVDLRKYLFVMTCNLVQELRPGRIGFAGGAGPEREADVEAGLHGLFRPEFLGRIDRVVHFRPLDQGAHRELLAHQIETLRTELRERDGIELEVAPPAQEWILMHISRGESGRETIRQFDRGVRAPLLRLLNEGQRSRGIQVTVVGDVLSIVWSPN